MSIYLYMFGKDRFWFLALVIVALGIPAYMIYKYGFMEYSQKRLENRIKNRQKLASMIVNY